MNDNREELIQAAEAAWRREQERETAFTAWLTTHLSMTPGAANDLAADILRTPVGDLPDDQLRLRVIFNLGLPAEYSYSEEQLELAIEHKRRGLSVH